MFHNGKLFTIGKLLPFICNSVLFSMLHSPYVCLFHQPSGSKLTNLIAETNTAAIYMLNTKITIQSKSFLMPWT